jgi:integrase
MTSRRPSIPVASLAEEAMSDYRPTRYARVFFIGDVLYYDVQVEPKRRKRTRFGVGSPLEAHRAQIAAQERADLIRAGRLDEAAETARDWASRPIAEAVAEYRAHLEAGGDSVQHVKTTISYLERWAAACGVTMFRAADAARLVRWLGGQSGWSARSRNYARASVLGFCRWGADFHALANPCPASLCPKANEDADRRRLSRALEAAEVVYLLASDLPLYRRAFYTVTLYTGLRWRELRRLEWSDVDLKAKTISISGAQSKTGKAADLPIHPRVAKVLRRWAASSGTTAGPLFSREPRIYTWRADLARARARWIARGATEHERALRSESGFLAYMDARGRRADRKAARMSFITALKRGGVDLRDAQRLARHSSPSLTANVYTDLRMPDLQAAVEKIGKAAPALEVKRAEKTA